MKLKMLVAACALVATNAFAASSMSVVEDGAIWNFNGNKLQIGTNTDHFEFETLEAGNYWANFAGSSTGHVSFTIDSVKLNGSTLTVQPGSDDYSGSNRFGFTLTNVALDDTFSLDVTYTAQTIGYQTEGKPFGSYNGTVTIAPAVPEPETYALLAAGLGAICFIARRRRQD